MGLADIRSANPGIFASGGEREAHEIAKILLDVTRDQLWNPKRWWINDKNANAQFMGHVRPGRRTYHFAEGRNHNFYIGLGMISDLQSSQTEAMKWLPAKEITSRGYFNGVPSLEAVLSAVMCHEFAHCVQFLTGKRLPKHIHDEGFYAILDRIHSSGAARTFMMSLRLAAKDAGHILQYRSGEN